ncbi:acyl-coenzyme A thioesterase 1-like [Phascolarctos cinereus]|uniref:Acyl-coenzyme A thioesterase 1-like n=1 Tax=Phascolarctos cinereus TaxID=38626 RepID=A0A6P5KCA9_PHACI|nr:acyl-coenzyme A thioesterase 1-like [Phascolarctos cinereus]
MGWTRCFPRRLSAARGVPFSVPPLRALPQPGAEPGPASCAPEGGRGARADAENGRRAVLQYHSPAPAVLGGRVSRRVPGLRECLAPVASRQQHVAGGRGRVPGLVALRAAAPPGPVGVRPRRPGGVTLTVTPPVGLADEPLHIQARGLSPGEPVTVRALAVSYYGRLFQSCAHYEADGVGALDLTRDPSRGGDYTGVEPMGLLWSLAPAGMENPYVRMVQRSVLKKPLRLEVTVHQAHNQTGLLLGQLLASARVERWYATPQIRAIRVREGSVRGSFFLPSGDGPFPGVIDMFGDEGGLHEFRASLLACRGFATLALPYFAFEDLPPIMKDLNLDYFAQAAKFVQNHPKVKGPKIGVIGSGKGAELAFSMAAFLPDVAAVISINGCISNTGTALHCGQVILPGLPFDLDKITVTSSGVYNVKETLVDPLDPAYGDSLIPIEKANSHFLFVVGEDDKQWNSSLYADLAIKRLEEHGKNNYTLLSYPNAGHRIDPPNSPFFPVVLDRWLGVPVLGGGQCRAHAIAQEESWKKILKFLKMHLE